MNDILDKALSSRAVTIIMASEIPPDFRDSEQPRIVEGMSWRSEEGASFPMLRAMYLLSMVAFTRERFEYMFPTMGPKGPRSRFHAQTREGFVVGAVGPLLRDHGRGIVKAVDQVLFDLIRDKGAPA